MTTLVEELLLLTFRDKTGRPLRLPEHSIEFAADRLRKDTRY